MRWFSRFVRISLVAIIVSVGLVAVQPPPAAEALSGSDLDVGYLIDDSKFYDNDAMSQAEIQAFLNAKIGTCQNTNCLNVYRMDTRSIAAEDYCKAYVGAASEPVSAIIFKVQAACNISAKAILVTLQKEQGLVTRTAPSLSILRKAMGMGCPDTSVCDSQFYGVFNQIYAAARQFNRYGNGSFTTRFQPGQVSNILFHPDAARCGSSPVLVKNRATMALYYYTPYQPNAAARANLTGTGDACSSYGNRNFWVYYNSYFGSPTGDPMGKIQALTPGNNAVTVSGWAVDPDNVSAPVTVRVYGAGWSRTVSANGASPDSNTAFPGAGTNHGYAATFYATAGSQDVCIDVSNQGQGRDISLGCRAVNVPSAATVSRTAGTDRYDTAANISKTNYAPGVPVAYIAAGENFPDALSVVPAAATVGGPVLLSTQGSLPPVVVTELQRLKPQKIVIVGGTAALSANVANQLAALPSAPPITRVGGTDRWDTSRQIAETVGVLHSGKAFIVSGSNFPDALSVASAAGALDSPVILLDGLASNIPAATSQALQRWGVTQLTVIGGTSAITTALQQKLAAIPGVVSVTRISGSDRFATSLAVNAALYPAATKGYVASAVAFADGLAGGAVAGRDSAPLYLAQPTCVPTGVIGHVLTAKVTSLGLLGGTAALGTGVGTLTPCN